MVGCDALWLGSRCHGRLAVYDNGVVHAPVLPNPALYVVNGLGELGGDLLLHKRHDPLDSCDCLEQWAGWCPNIVGAFGGFHGSTS